MVTADSQIAQSYEFPTLEILPKVLHPNPAERQMETTKDYFLSPLWNRFLVRQSLFSRFPHLQGSRSHGFESEVESL